MPTIRGNATFNAESTSNNKVSKDDGKLNLSNVTKANSFIENTGSDVNNNQKKQLVSSVIETKNTIHVQGFSSLEEGKRMAAQYSGSVPSVGISQASEVLNVESVKDLTEAFKNNLRKFETSNPRQWLSINNHAPVMESIVEETNSDNKVYESTTEKYLVRLDYKIDHVTSDKKTPFTYTRDEVVGSANIDNIETTMFLVVDKYVKDENGKWVYKSSSLANEIETEFPLKGDFTTTINDKEIYVGTIEASVNDPRNKDINGLDMAKVNFDQKSLRGLTSGNTIGTTPLLNENTKYRQINGFIFGPNVDLSRMILRDIELSDIDLNGANFKGSKFINVKSSKIRGNPTLPDGYKLINGYIVGPYVDLENAVLRDADLGNINISGVKLTGANLNGITSSNVTYDENTKLPENYKIVNGYILGPNVILEGNLDFRSADLSGDFRSADVNGVSFYNVNVKSADFTGANLTGTILEKADFSNANLTGIISGNIQEGSITENTLVKLPENYSFYNGYILGPGVNLDGVDLTQFDFSSPTYTNLKLTNIIGTPILPSGYVMRGGFVVGKYMNFSNEDLSKLDFSGLDVSNSIFTGAKITALNLTDTIMNNVVSGNIEQTLIFAKEYTYKLVNGFLIGPGTIFNGAQLSSVDLRGVTFNQSQGLNIVGIPKLPIEYKVINKNIVGPNVNLTGANFEFSDLSEANLRGVKSGQVLTNEQILLPENYRIINGYIIGQDVVLTGADLRNLNLGKKTTLEGEEEEGVTLEGVVSGNVKTDNTTFPSGYEEIDGYIVGKGVNLTGANLKGADLKGVDLRNANLQNADLTNANLQNADLTDALLEGVISGNVQTDNTKLPTGYKVIKGYIVGKGVILKNTVLRNADLRNMDLRNVNFQNADLRNADLSNAQLEGVISGNVQTDFLNVVPSGYKVINGYIVGKGVNLTNANDNLQSADLTNLNISGADLSNVDLSKAILKMVISGNVKININTKFPPGYREANGHIVGKDVDLRNGRLLNVNLSDIDLSESLLNGVASENIYINDNTKFPEGYSIMGGYIFGKDVSFEDVTLSNIDLSNMDLSKANFTRCRSNNVTINENTKLPYGYVVRNGFILGNDVSLKDAYIKDINLNNLPWYVNLRNVIFDGVRSKNISYVRITGLPSILPEGYIVGGGYILGKNINLSGERIDLGSTIYGFKFNLSGANFEEADLTRSGFLEIDFTGANFKKAKLDYCNFAKCDLTNVNMSEANLFDANITECPCVGLKLNGINGERIELNELTLTDMDLSNTNFKDSYMQSVTFTATNLNGCDFSSGDTVRFTRIFDCTFNTLDLGKVNFKLSNIERNKFINCYLVDCNFSEVAINRSAESNDFTGSFLSGSIFNNTEYLISNYNECELSYIDFSNTVLDGSTFVEAKLNYANLRGTKIRNYNRTGGGVYRPDLSGADLTGADLTGADLQNVITDENTIGPDGTKGWNPN